MTFRRLCPKKATCWKKIRKARFLYKWWRSGYKPKCEFANYVFPNVDEIGAFENVRFVEFSNDEVLSNIKNRVSYSSHDLAKSVARIKKMYEESKDEE